MKGNPDWLDERIRLGEIPQHLEEQAAARAMGPDFEANQAALEESDRQILSRLPPDRFAAEVERRRRAATQTAGRIRAAGNPSRAAWGGLAIACLAGFVFVLPRLAPGPDPLPADPVSLPSPPNSDESSKPSQAPPGRHEPPVTGTPSAAIVADAGSTWRTKGGIDLILQRETPGGLLPVSEADPLEAGARIRISVPDSLPWAAVYSIDSRGEMAQHWPMAGDSAMPVRGALPRSWELDDTPGMETFVLVWSDKPFGLEAVRKAIFLDRLRPRLGVGLQTKVEQLRRAEVGPK